MRPGVLEADYPVWMVAAWVYHENMSTEYLLFVEAPDEAAASAAATKRLSADHEKHEIRKINRLCPV